MPTKLTRQTAKNIAAQIFDQFSDFVVELKYKSAETTYTPASGTHEHNEIHLIQGIVLNASEMIHSESIPAGHKVVVTLDSLDYRAKGIIELESGALYEVVEPMNDTQGAVATLLIKGLAG